MTVHWQRLACRRWKGSFEEATVWDLLPRTTPSQALMTVSLSGFIIPSQLLWIESQLRSVSSSPIYLLITGCMESVAGSASVGYSYVKILMTVQASGPPLRSYKDLHLEQSLNQALQDIPRVMSFQWYWPISTRLFQGGSHRGATSTKELHVWG